MKKSMFLFLFLAIVANAFSQVAISTNGSLPDASAMLDVASTEKGLLIPRLTMAERDLVDSPAQGLLIYQTDNAPGFYFYDGSGWAVIGSESMNINGLADGKTGGNSVFLGLGAGASDDGSDNKNVAVGVDALNANTTGSNNTVMGVFADYYNQGGNNNTIIGYEAGKKNSIHNKSGNIFLGYQAGKNETDDNKLYIENSSSTTPLIGGDFDDDEIYLHGDVGIGTTSILERLHITEDNGTTDGSDGCFALIQNTNASSNVLSGIRFKNGTYSNTSKGGIFYRDMLTYARGDIVFVNNSTNSTGNATFADARMIIKNDGKVGIGTTSPGAELEVDGQVKITGGTPGASKVLTSDADGLASWQAATGATDINGLTDGKTDGTSVFLGENAGANDDNYNCNVAIGIEALNANISGFNNTATGYQSLYSNTTGQSNMATGYMALYSNTNGSYNTANGSTALYSNTTGSYNTTNGQRALYSNTTGNNNTANGHKVNYFNEEGSNNTIMGFEAGCGTSLHNKSGNVFLGYRAGYYETGDNKLYIENSCSSIPLIYGEFDNDLLRINGTLDINNAYQFPTADGGNGQVLQTDGSGTLSWNDDRGATQINDLTDGKTGGNSVFLGSGAGANDDGTDSKNVAVGIDALNSNASGYWNTATGYRALRTNTTGNSNTAVGYNALKSNTTGDCNTANGSDALYSNTTGAINTATGNQALYFNTTGYENTATGTKTLYSNTTGNYNTGNGSVALYYNETGNYNTANGSYALYTNTTGSNNTANGYYALKSNTTGNCNIVNGSWANYYNQEGSNNTIIGYSAGKGSAFHNKSGNVFLGYRAGFNETGDNKLYIENSNSSTPLIGGDFAADEVYLHGDVGIGTSDLLERLHIAEDNGTTDGSDGSFALLQNTNTSANVLTGIRFLNGTTANTSKGGIFYRDMLTYGRGDIVFVNNSTGSAANATFADARMTIKNDGNVGIGTTSPGAELEVNGQVKITGGIPGASKVLTSDADGLASWQSAAIGATEINELSDGKTGGGSVFLGSLAGFNDDGIDNKNVAVGIKALRANTSGYDNTANGFESLYSNTTGHSNTACGWGSLYNNTTGNCNTAVGCNTDISGNLNNTGAFGYYACATASNRVHIGNTSVSWIGGQVNWNTYSDKRFKRNIKENVSGLDFIMKLRPVTYQWDIRGLDKHIGIPDSAYNDETMQRARADQEAKTYTGFLAQEVERAARETGFDFSGVQAPVNEITPYSLSYAEFVVPLVKAVQELAEEVERLEEWKNGRMEEMESLRTQNINLETRLEKLEAMENEMKELKALVKQLASKNDIASNNEQ